MYPEHALPGTGARWAPSIATPGSQPVITAPGTTHPLSEAQSNLGSLGKGKSCDDRGKDHGTTDRPRSRQDEGTRLTLFRELPE